MRENMLAKGERDLAAEKARLDELTAAAAADLKKKETEVNNLMDRLANIWK